MLRFLRSRALLATCAAAALAAPTLVAAPAQAETVLRIAMTAGDIPDWRGQPDQGFEGYRFVGYSLYDPLVAWDLSSYEKEVTIKPGLATKWYNDPDDGKKWIFELRQGVKFHDGCPWNADSATWNFERLINEKSPAFVPFNFARSR